IPWESSSLTGAFEFSPGAKVPDTQTTSVAPAPAPSSSAPRAPDSTTGAAKGCTNCAEMVSLPGGAFMMGSPESEKDRQDNEGPQKKIAIKAFSIGKNDVTVGQFAEFIKATSYQPTHQCDISGTNKLDSGSWDNPSFEQTDKDPVVCVSWKDARAYVD